MARIELNSVAPDFTLTDFNGQSVTLSDYQNDKNVVLVFNRGFT
ncbi:MAG: redoxin domain-containing protein [Anaerolineae bacterium]|nr:redoxin domain-containing protein [Anaerolineae bacterium]MCO5187904.1 redoxin domain-containing protein [Anaerolineae bacterium]MCO5192662.1 redoxin domain-containing protein [Anaerolineae bacterium]MCO5197826.1 redoxin domain-containing protein [Anaerolineae bacterium]MCO5205322.1 redoxin domain-containing protein [Anaerolineae bacterium]